VPDRWWTVFDDPALDRQVEQSLGGSFTLAAAVERLRAAQAVVRRDASDLLPDVNGLADAEGVFRTNGRNSSLFALGLDGSYEVDLWDRIESAVDAQRFRADATEADYQAVALALSGEITSTWFALIESRAQLALLNEQLETNITGAEILEDRFEEGQERAAADLLRQRQLVEATREQIVIVRPTIDLLEHRLAVLQGRPPQQAWYVTGQMLPPLPPLPATGLPAELLQRRPDVRRDYLALWAADRDLASAVSNQYPRLNLFASVTTAAESPENLFRDWIVVTAGQLIAPLIDGGQRRAQVDINAALLRELIAQYGDTVLTAYREVEDALARERYQLQRLESLHLQLGLSRQSRILLREQYLIGGTDYLDVLTAITQEQRLQRDILSARLDLILTRIDLYLALAGGFDPRPYAGQGGSVNEVDNERLPETILTPLGTRPDHSDRLPLDPQRFGGGDRGDQPNGTDGPAN